MTYTKLNIIDLEEHMRLLRGYMLMLYNQHVSKNDQNVCTKDDVKRLYKLQEDILEEYINTHKKWRKLKKGK